MNANLRTDSILGNVVAALTVSFVAISLGAAFGVLSGRGAFVGILSAGIIAAVTAALGGTRVQCSGPTAPMTAVTALLVGVAHTSLAGDPDRLINLAIVLSGAMVVAMGVFRLGRFIRLIPRVVVSGFMSGIAILIWTDQIGELFGIGRQALEGDLLANVAIAGTTVVAVLGLPSVIRKLFRGRSIFLPTTLIVITVMSALSGILGWQIELVSFDNALSSWAEVQAVVASQLPTDWSFEAIAFVAPMAAQLAMLCYLDTLLTSLVIDRMTRTETRQNKELVAQGLANTTVGMLGGVPGAQATIRSVLIIKEGATLRWAGVLVGVFVLVEMVLLQDLIRHIPVAVLSGVLLKVGYDVFDRKPVEIYLARLINTLRSDLAMAGRPVPQHHVGHTEMAFVIGTAAITVFWNLNVAVIGATLIFHGLSKIRSVPDLARDEADMVRSED